MSSNNYSLIQSRGALAGYAYSRLIDDEKRRLHLLLENVTGFPPEAFDFDAPASVRRQALVRHFHDELCRTPASLHPFMLTQLGRKGDFLAVAGVCLSDSARAAAEAVTAIRRERGELETEN